MTRFISKIFIIVSLSFALWGCSSTRPSSTSGVRHLDVETADLSSELRFGIEDIVMLDSQQTIEARLSPKAAAQLLSQLDLAKEQLVIVPWNTGGPPFGTLQHRESQAHPGWVEFYVQGPRNIATRGLSLRLGLGFFAIPKNRQALLTKGEQP